MKELRDIVYILKEDIVPDELIYSLRSVDKYFPHRFVWFVGGQPAGLTPDKRIIHKQAGVTKWAKVQSSFREIINNDEISEEFYLFNDDFFVLKPQSTNFINFANGTLEHRIVELARNLGHNHSRYASELNRLRTQLIYQGYDTVNFALHLPMLLNKTKVAEFITKFNTPMFRSGYGNMYDIPYISHKDVKIYDMDKIPSPDWDYASTTEQSFADGQVGKYIREKFQEPSKFEAPNNYVIHEQYTEEGDVLYA